MCACKCTVLVPNFKLKTFLFVNVAVREQIDFGLGFVSITSCRYQWHSSGSAVPSNPLTTLRNRPCTYKFCSRYFPKFECGRGDVCVVRCTIWCTLYSICPR